MISNYAYTPAIWPSFVTVLLLIVLSIYSRPRRSVPGALPFAIGCLFAALWAAGSGMEAAAVYVQTKIFWFKFQGAGVPEVTNEWVKASIAAHRNEFLGAVLLSDSE